MNNAVLEATNLHKAYHDTGEKLVVLDQVNLTLMPGEMVAVAGVSGAGKSTLLHILGGLDTPSSGEVSLLGKPLSRASEGQKDHLRQHYLGFIYQFHHLLPELNALENVMMPLLIRGESVGPARQQAKDYLIKVGLKQRSLHRVAELSGGERQRVAIARALVKKPQCVLADEPTGNLDEATAAVVFELLQSLCREQQAGMLVVTHNSQFAAKMDRTLYLHAAQLQ